MSHMVIWIRCLSVSVTDDHMSFDKGESNFASYRIAMWGLESATQILISSKEPTSAQSRRQKFHLHNSYTFLKKSFLFLFHLCPKNLEKKTFNRKKGMDQKSQDRAASIPCLKFLELKLLFLDDANCGMRNLLMTKLRAEVRCHFLLNKLLLSSMLSTTKPRLKLQKSTSPSCVFVYYANQWPQNTIFAIHLVITNNKDRSDFNKPMFRCSTPLCLSDQINGTIINHQIGIVWKPATIIGSLNCHKY